MKTIVKNIYKKTIEYFFKIIYGRIYLKKYKDNLIKKTSFNKIFKKKYFTYLIPNGRIFTDAVQNVSIIKKNTLIGECSFQHKNNKLVNANENPVLKIGTPKIKVKFKGIVLSLIQGASAENYFHWLMDILPKLKICDQNYPIKKIDFFYLPKLFAAQHDSLKFLGIKKKQLINSNIYKHISADELIVTSHPWYKHGTFHNQSNNLPSWSIKWIRKSFLKYKKKFQISDKIFVERTDSKYSYCQIINYTELKLVLEKLGFKFIEASKYSFAKQIFLFWNAKFIIGAHGAALTNTVFCKKKTKILEIRPFGHKGRYFERIAEVIGLNYQFIESQKKYLEDPNGDIFVDLKEIKKILNNPFF